MYSYYQNIPIRNQQSVETTEMGHIRILHAAVGVPKVDIYLNDKLVAQELEYGMFTEYLAVLPDRYILTVYETGTKENSVITKELTVSSRWQTVVAVGTIDTLNVVLINDSNLPPEGVKTKIRCIHLSPNLPAVDIIFNNNKVLFENLKYLERTNYVKTDPGDYKFDVKIAITGQNVLTISDIKVEENNSYSIYLIGLVDTEPLLTALVLVDGKNT